MKISERGIAAIKAFEGLRLFAYPDPASGGEPWTIGWGHTLNVHQNQHINEATAEEYLRIDLGLCELCVNNAVRVPLSQGQFDALCSWVFNLGCGAFKTSTLLALLNERDYEGAADEFLRWNKARVNGELQPVAGLTERRKREREMFLSNAPWPTTHHDDLPDAIGMPPLQPPRPDAETYTQAPPAKGTAMPIPAIAGMFLPTIVELIPKLAGLFGSGSKVAERNTAAATAVLDVVQKATNAVNAQDAVERMQRDPVALQAATKAVEDGWFKLHQAAEASTAAAREFSVSYAQQRNVRTVAGNLTFLELLSLMLIVATLAGGMSVLLWGGIDAQLKGAVVTLMLIGGYTSVTNFWYGSSLGSKKKDDKEPT